MYIYIYIYLCVSGNPPQFFSQYADAVFSEKETIRVGGQSGLLDRDVDRKEGNHDLDITQGVTFLKPSKTKRPSAETNTATCLQGATDPASASSTPDKPEDEQCEASGCNTQVSGDAQKTDDAQCPDAHPESESKQKLPLKKISETLTVTAATASESSADSTEKFEHPLEREVGEENLIQSQEKEAPKARHGGTMTLEGRETEDKNEKETEKETEIKHQKEREKETEEKAEKEAAEKDENQTSVSFSVKETEKETEVKSEKEREKETEEKAGKEAAEKDENQTSISFSVKETEKETEVKSEKEREEETGEKAEKEAVEKDENQTQTCKKKADRSTASQSKDDNKNNNKLESPEASAGLPLPTPVTAVSDQSESQEKSQDSQGKPKKSYAGALKEGTANQREKVIIFTACWICFYLQDHLLFSITTPSMMLKGLDYHNCFSSKFLKFCKNIIFTMQIAIASISDVAFSGTKHFHSHCTFRFQLRNLTLWLLGLGSWACQ